MNSERREQLRVLVANWLDKESPAPVCTLPVDDLVTQLESFFWESLFLLDKDSKIPPYESPKGALVPASQVTQNEPIPSQSAGEEQAKPADSGSGKRKRPLYTPAFEAFWSRYHKGSKVKAFGEWSKLSELDQAAAADGLDKYVKSETWQRASAGEDYRPDTERWLKYRRWEDSESAPSGAPRPTASGSISKSSKAWSEAVAPRPRDLYPAWIREHLDLVDLRNKESPGSYVYGQNVMQWLKERGLEP